MADKIYLLQDDETLEPMEETAYDSEALLQVLLAKCPDLLAGDQMQEADPRRWLLVSREIRIPDDDGATGRWSIDHLFLDQDAIPTLVEVKRSTDSRIRREVVGQMLDYAANAVVYWPVETLRAKFEAKHPEDADDLIADHMDADPEEHGSSDHFWEAVKTNLRAGRIRMVFVADRIPTELQRVVEFLNEQMDPAEVLAVEVRQFVGRGQKSLVPKLVGQTAAAATKKSRTGRGRGAWDEQAYFETLSAKVGRPSIEAARALQAWASEKLTGIWWGGGATDGSMIPYLYVHGGRRKGGHNFHFFSLWTSGRLIVTLKWLGNKPPFNDEDLQRELVRRLNEIDGVAIDEDRIGKMPSFPLEILGETAALEQFVAALDWSLQRIWETFKER